jgi:hypothetical protein
MLGKRDSENIYGDALEYEFKLDTIPYEINIIAVSIKT